MENGSAGQKPPPSIPSLLPGEDGTSHDNPPPREESFRSVESLNADGRSKKNDCQRVSRSGRDGKESSHIIQAPPEQGQPEIEQQRGNEE
jgi:hypothetical protein